MRLNTLNSLANHIHDLARVDGVLPVVVYLELDDWLDIRAALRALNHGIDVRFIDHEFHSSLMVCGVGIRIKGSYT